jgi:hypothetical protein
MNSLHDRCSYSFDFSGIVGSSSSQSVWGGVRGGGFGSDCDLRLDFLRFEGFDDDATSSER